MRLKNVATTSLACAIVCAMAVSAYAFKLPKIPKIPGVGGIGIPGVDALLKREPALTTSLADTTPEIPYLDDYNPTEFAPLAEVPRDSQAHFLRYPGTYEFVAQSYCLHAGSYGPRKGNGYLYAPLKGKRADVINNILRNSVSHPEVHQNDIQLLIWGILAESKVSTMPQNLQDAANALLTKKEISQLNGGALGKIPPEVSAQLMPKLPPLARMAFDAENTLRGMLSQATMPMFSEFEKVAVLSGDPSADLRDPSKEEDVPSGRWSYHPNGYFIRMFPSSYYRTKVQIYEPETFEINRDEAGRITRIVDPRGNSIDVAYSTSAPLRVAGDTNLQGHAFASVQFVNTGDAAHPGLRREKNWKDTGWTWVGNGTGAGQISVQDSFRDAAQRYSTVQKYFSQMQELDKNLVRNKYPVASATSSSRITLSNLAHLRAALKALTANPSPEDAWVASHVEILAAAWQSALEDEINSSQRTVSVPSKATLHLASYRYARRLKSFDGEFERQFGAGGGFGGGGAGMPGSPGRQRLAQSSRPAKDKNSRSPDSIDRARRAIGGISNGSDGVTIATGGAGGYISGYIPGKIFGHILDEILDKGRKITDALSIDPPRDDFQSFTVPRQITIPRVKPDSTISAARAAAWNATFDAAAEMQANLQAAHIAVDRHGGALQANNHRWAYYQGAAIVHYKKAAGISMVKLANSLDDIIKISQQEKLDNPTLDAKMVENYRQQLATTGFSDEAKQAAQIVGLTSDELAQLKQERLAMDPSRFEGNKLSVVLTKTATHLRDLGTYLNSLPPVDLPQESADTTKQARAF